MPIKWLIAQTDNWVEGTIRLSNVDPKYYAVYRVKGNVSADTFDSEASEFLENVPWPGGMWCLTVTRLRYRSLGNISTLEGTWSVIPVPHGCPPETKGSIKIQRRE